MVFACHTQAIAKNIAATSPKSGELRVLVWQGANDFVSTADSFVARDQQYLQRYAKQHNLTLRFIRKQQYDQLIPALLANEGDVIAANMAVSDLRKHHVDFTLPIVDSTEYIIHGRHSESLHQATDLAGRTIAVQAGTSYAITAIGLAKVYPDINIVEIASHKSLNEILEGVATGQFDLTIIDSHILKSALKHRRDIVKSIQANRAKDIAWAVRKESFALKNSLDQFLRQQGWTTVTSDEGKTSWDDISERRTIRFAMQNVMSSYYLWKGQLMGFHYELARDFAKRHNLRYEIVVAANDSELFELVKTGKADIALGFHSPQAHHQQGFAFSRPYHYATEQIVTGADDPPIRSLEDLKYRNITVAKDSSYWFTLKALQEHIPQMTVTAAPEGFDTSRLIAAVANGDVDVTLADNHLIGLEKKLNENVTPSIFIGERKPQSWLFKQGCKTLQAKINGYIRTTYRSVFYNVIHNKYFENNRLIKRHRDAYYALQDGGALSPYDALVEKYAIKYDFDPKLLIAQMYQESRFDPNALSDAGAQGLFQVMPQTAQQLNINNITTPENGIHAGVKYMAWVAKQIKELDIPEEQQIWFTLASYNAGYGHVLDARRLARDKGWQDDVWFGHVERAMLLLSQAKYASKARYGYVRGAEPVNYVRNIRHKYDIIKRAPRETPATQITQASYQLAR
ncbi:transporter substrate-binding domain-containing protein [Thalassotalea maritima]|uniref:transporter substrate-binding domain-containing protein n=1 Tax=Thalassotalea maritima TaxID=3242416 RepID=UPI0035293CF9